MAFENVFFFFAEVDWQEYVIIKTNEKFKLGKPFPQEDELDEKLARLTELNTLLNIDDKAIENAAIAAEMKNDKISAGKTKPMSNVISESKPSILGRIREMQSNMSSGILKEKSSTKGKSSEIS